jgi:lysophospholipase-3
VFNKTDGTTHSPEGVDIKILDWGNTSTVEWLDPSKISTGHYFATIAENAVHWGYTRGKDIRGMPYDFRKAPSRLILLILIYDVHCSDEMAKELADLKTLIEDTYRINGNRKVVTLGHSMGNVIAQWFFNHQTQVE